MSRIGWSKIVRDDDHGRVKLQLFGAALQMAQHSPRDVFQVGRSLAKVLIADAA